MIDTNDSKTDELCFEYEEIFEEDVAFDPYEEYGVSPKDFAWYGI